MQTHRFKTKSDYHQFRKLPKSKHPLISVINLDLIEHCPVHEISLINDFYSIALKRNFTARMRYGQQDFEFDEGLLFFMSPGQLLRIEVEQESDLKVSGWMLLVHPDFLWNTQLAKTIKQYEYFDYSVNEALFLSDKEETTIAGIMQSIQQEYHSNIDKFSQVIIIAQLELLLNFADRFYNRQFITRKITNHSILNRLEDILAEYFNSDLLETRGSPSVQYVADALNVSSNYLSGVLKVLTGHSTQQHIHNKFIEKAKERLSTTVLSVSEIAYELGFGHPQSFSKLFKTKTSLSPLEFRRSFN